MNNCVSLSNFASLNNKIMKKFIVFLVTIGLILPIVVSCENGTTKHSTEISKDTVSVDTLVIIDTIKPVSTKKVEEPKKNIDKKGEPKQETPKVVDIPQEIGASPDAVYSLDDNETESSPKYPEGEKKLKKLLKKQLRKAQKGEKAKFKASIVIKKDGTVGRVQFTECGYADEYKPEIVSVLQALPMFTPGMKNGVAVDSWYYLNYKR